MKNARILLKGVVCEMQDYWKDFDGLRDENMDAARIKLAEMLEEYVPLLWQKVIIVYDAYRIKGKKASFETFRGVEVVYTAEGQTADTFIERLVSKLLEVDGEVEVASSDNLEQQIVLWKGARRLSARELKERLQESRASIRKRLSNLSSKTMLDERLSERVKTILEKWRRL
ncbi:MAG: NYN domain-containing protein [Bacillota bacterium]|nr:NYN domain-containing protein [Bacillota bacterium]